ncbi:hypothetical protein K488DRAFT_91628 [Vararia minispora EC-137]|uniref:Uncharacterized protein n=1 Tax=Vararia minispora EC-137 TaxID=1314806 RepID=A0ACB8Q5J7_9AGAM|nr:hypothetical protein K488DRAFT_91628 [Vararia minispora EC-137]
MPQRHPAALPPPSFMAPTLYARPAFLAVSSPLASPHQRFPSSTLHEVASFDALQRQPNGGFKAQLNPAMRHDRRRGQQLGRGRPTSAAAAAITVRLPSFSLPLILSPSSVLPFYFFSIVPRADWHRLHRHRSASDMLALLVLPTWRAHTQACAQPDFVFTSVALVVGRLQLSGVHIAAWRHVSVGLEASLPLQSQCVVSGRSITRATGPLLVGDCGHKTLFSSSLSLVPHGDHPVTQAVTLLPLPPFRLPFPLKKYDSTLQMLRTIDTGKVGKPLPGIRRSTIASLAPVLCAVM